LWIKLEHISIVIEVDQNIFFPITIVKGLKLYLTLTFAFLIWL